MLFVDVVVGLTLPEPVRPPAAGTVNGPLVTALVNAPVFTA
jgi:hypothetical protein